MTLGERRTAALRLGSRELFAPLGRPFTLLGLTVFGLLWLDAPARALTAQANSALVPPSPRQHPTAESSSGKPNDAPPNDAPKRPPEQDSLESGSPGQALEFSSERLALARAGWSLIDYDWTARLEESSRTIRASGTISITNHSRSPLRELWLHLYLNAFASQETLFFRSSGAGLGASRSQNHLTEPGSTKVLSFVDQARPDDELWRGASRHSPGDPKDATDLNLPLNVPIEPGQKRTYAVTFESELPGLVERTGVSGDFFFVAQWFPKIARLDPSGQFRHFAFHPNSEFAANFGSYRVRIDVPERFVVAVPGNKRQETRARGRRNIDASLGLGHDFAFSAWPGFVESSRTIEGTRTSLFIPAGHDTAAKRTWHSVEGSLRDFGRRFGPYPYETLTVVYPPPFAEAAGGMEYPALITTGGALALDGLGARWTEAVTAHELAHQWFYGLLASDEHASPFLDESLATWAEATFLHETYGNGSAFASPWLRLSIWATLRYQALLGDPKQSALLSAPEYGSFFEIASVLYGRAPLALETIRRCFGAAAFGATLRTYTQSFRFGHPEPSDLFAVVEAELDAEAASALRRLLQGEQAGYRIHSLEQKRLGAGFVSRVRVEPEGTVMLPTTLVLEFAGEPRQTLEVRGRLDAEVHHKSALLRGEVDPARAILVDPHFHNNRQRVEQPQDPRAPLVSAALTQLWAEALLWSVF